MKKTLLFIFYILMNVPLFAQETDHCKDILSAGFYNKTNVSNTGNYSSDIKNWLVSDNFKDYASHRTGGFNIGIPIDGLPLSFGASSSDADYQKLKQYLNSGNSSNINQTFANYIAQQVVDKTVVNAWSSCMTANSTLTGLQAKYEGNPNGAYFNILIYWAPRLGVNSSKLGGITVSGAKFSSNQFKAGSTIGTEPIRIPLLRQNNEEINVTINTQDNNGSASINIPSNAPVPTPSLPTKTNEQKCYEGDLEGCRLYREEIIKNCADKSFTQAECDRLKGAIGNLIEYMSFNPNYLSQDQYKQMILQDRLLQLFPHVH